MGVVTVVPVMPVAAPLCTSASFGLALGLALNLNQPLLGRGVLYTEGLEDLLQLLIIVDFKVKIHRS
jgi:hypothetical protein